MIHTTAYHIPQ